TTVAPDLADLPLVILPDGFSYGDYLRAGALAATQPIMRVLEDAVKAQELTLIGLGNGFQVLTETGLLPGGFVASDFPVLDRTEVDVVVEESTHAITSAYDTGERLRLVLKGAFSQDTPTQEEPETLGSRGDVIIRVCESAAGSVNNIAGISS